MGWGPRHLPLKAATTAARAEVAEAEGGPADGGFVEGWFMLPHRSRSADQMAHEAGSAASTTAGEAGGPQCALWSFHPRVVGADSEMQ
jgi:hypothetical protein